MELHKMNPVSAHPPEPNELRIAELQVKVLTKWDDKIPVYDEGEIVGYESGLVLEILPQTIVYTGQKTEFLGHLVNKG